MSPVAMPRQAATVAVVALLLLSGCQAQFNKCFKDNAVAPAGQSSFDFSGVDRFGLRLFELLGSHGADKNTNLMVSPYSIWSALSLALMGASGNTRLQLQQALGLPTTKSGAYRTKYALDFLLNSIGSGLNGAPDLLRVDHAYFDQSLHLRQCVYDVIHNVEVLDFSDTGATATKINNDVSIGTGGQIKDFLNPSALTNAVFVLINAIYFRGTWVTKFDVKDTNKQVFYNAKGANIATADMMTQQGSFNIVQSPALGATILELPYSNSNMSMLVILPDIKTPTVEGVLKALSPYTLDQALQASKKLSVKVFLPKFDIKTEVKDELVQALKTLNLTDMFNPSLADFSDFTARKPLAADTVIHQAVVKVDEAGTTAAAVTAIIGTRSGPGKVFQFVANRPFAFLIYEKRIKSTLFAGVVRDPTK